MKLKAFSKKKKKGGKKAEINPQQKLVTRKPVLKYITLRLVFAPWHSILEPYYTHSVEKALHTHAVKSPYL